MPTGKILAGTDKGVIVLSLPPPRDDDVKEGAFSEPCVLNWLALGCTSHCYGLTTSIVTVPIAV